MVAHAFDPNTEKAEASSSEFPDSQGCIVRPYLQTDKSPPPMVTTTKEESRSC